METATTALTLLDWVKIALTWYGLGIATILVTRTVSNGELRVRDIDDCLKLGLAGPLLYVFAICSGIHTVCCKIQDVLTNHKDKVLWRSKRKKTEHILYGKSDTTEED